MQLWKLRGMVYYSDQECEKVKIKICSKAITISVDTYQGNLFSSNV